MIPTDDTGTTAVLCKPRASGDDPPENDPEA